MKTSRKNSKKRSRKLKKNAKRLAAYSAAAAATVMTTGDRSANAAEVVWDIPDVTVDNTTLGVAFQMVTGAATAATYGFYYYSEGNFRLHPADGGYLYGPAYSIGATPVLGFVGSLSVTPPTSTNPNSYSLALAYPQAASDSVSAGDTFVLGSSLYYNRFAYLSWAGGQSGYAGVRFALNAGADTHYGWVQITKLIGGKFTLSGFGYNDTADAASHPIETREILGDFDDNKILDSADFVVLRDNGLTDLSGLTPEAAALLGDLDGDLDNDIDDFDLFRDSYEFENGGGAFAAMVAGLAVPEPSSVLLLAAGAAGLGMWRKKRSE